MWRHCYTKTSNDCGLTGRQTTCHAASTRHGPNVDLMLAQRRRRWANNKTTMGQCLACVGMLSRPTIGKEPRNDAGSMSSQRRKRWPSTNTMFTQPIMGVTNICYLVTSQPHTQQVTIQIQGYFFHLYKAVWRIINTYVKINFRNWTLAIQYITPVYIYRHYNQNTSFSANECNTAGSRRFPDAGTSSARLAQHQDNVSCMLGIVFRTHVYKLCTACRSLWTIPHCPCQTWHTVVSRACTQLGK